MGFRRLSIIDVSGGHQPMANEDGTIWIVFNGEIYNHLELRTTLEGRGHRYATSSDTETILHLYKNPLRTLVWSPSRSMVVSGLTSKQAVQIKLDVDSPPAKKA